MTYATRAPDGRFDNWIDELTIAVIQDEFGYEPGEFTVYPEHWRPMFDRGLTPRQAWQRALDAFGQERDRLDREQRKNWARIQKKDNCIPVTIAPAGDNGETHD